MVYEFGVDEAVKIPNAEVPRAWLHEELRLTLSVTRAGAPVPGGARLEQVDGQDALVVRRVDGPSMWEQMVAEPDRVDEFAEELARVQVELVELPASFELPSQRDRIESKIRRAAAEHGSALRGVLERLPADLGPLGICHGDLHPRNVLMAERGLLLVDWFDASRGVLAAEVARTVIMLEDSEVFDGEIDSGFAPMLREFCRRYRDAACSLGSLDRELVDAWVLAQGVARLAEGFGSHRLPGLFAALAA